MSRIDRRLGAKVPIGATVGIASLALLGYEVNENIIPIIIANPLALGLIGLVGLLAALHVVRS